MTVENGGNNAAIEQPNNESGAGAAADGGGGNSGASNSGSGVGTALTPGSGQEGAPQQGKSVPDWATGLPDDLKSHPSLANYSDLPTFVKSAIEAEKLIGKKGVIKPGENATPEEINKFYNELGRPEKAEGYALKRPESWPEDLAFTETLVPKTQEIFHKNGLTDAQAKGLWEDYHGMIAEASKEQGAMAKVDVDRGIAELKVEWGGEDKYKANVETAVMAVKEFGGDKLVDFLNETGLGDHPALIKAFANAGKQLREDGFIGGDTKNSGQMNEVRAKAEIERLKNDKAFNEILYSNKLEDRDAQKEAKMKMENLYKIAYPTFTS